MTRKGELAEGLGPVEIGWSCFGFDGTAQNRTKSSDWTLKSTMAKKVTFVCVSVIYIKVCPVCANKLNEVHGTMYDCITQLSPLILLCYIGGEG